MYQNCKYILKRIILQNYVLKKVKTKNAHNNICLYKTQIIKFGFVI